MAPVSATVPTPRIRLARAALGAALGVPGVTRAVGGAGHVKWDGRVALEGVLVVAAGPGVYDVSLRLATAPVPLHPVALRIRVAVEKAAARTDARPGRIDVTFADLDADGGVGA
jgi:hypothetical protein